MRTASAIAVSIAVVCACGTDPAKTDTGKPDRAHDLSSISGTAGGSCTPASCPLGTATFTTVLGASNPSQLMSLAAEPDGNVLVGTSNPSTAAGITGVTELSASGAVVTTLLFGSLVATDAAGSKYIAGAFSSPIDVGQGIVLTPQGNIDVFIVKLDVKGDVILAKALGLCGDGLTAMAVATDGRIALSGSAMGTVVLSASGDIQLQLDDVGQVAFDSSGDLLIAGSQTASAFAFLDRFDRTGKIVFRTSFEGQGVRLSGLAIDAHDNIIFVGDTTAFVNIFGTDITAQFAPESGRVTGAFVAKVAPSFAPLLVLDLGIVEANGVAVDPGGQIFIAGAVTVNTGFFRAAVIVKIDALGAVTTFDFGGNANGRAVAIAVDSCGSVLAGLVLQQSPSPLSLIDAVVQKLAL